MTKISRCCGAEVKIQYHKGSGAKLEYCSKCNHYCDTIDQPELQRADDVIGHDVSGTESRQAREPIQNEENTEDLSRADLYAKGYEDGLREVQKEEKEEEVECPICGRLNSDNYPLIIDGYKVMGGCVKCWEFQCKEGTDIAKEILPESFFKNHSTTKEPEWKEQVKMIEGQACPIHGLGTLEMCDYGPPNDWCDYCKECAEEDEDSKKEPPELILASEYIENLIETLLQSRDREVEEKRTEIYQRGLSNGRCFANEEWREKIKDKIQSYKSYHNPIGDERNIGRGIACDALLEELIK